jgi:hypothetical protein
VTELPDVAVGATWRCADLHLHTPGVCTFELPRGVDVHDDGNREHLADEYVVRLAGAGIQVAAITDYQGVRQPWFRLIRERGEARGIVVLPGAEMSIGETGRPPNTVDADAMRAGVHVPRNPHIYSRVAAAQLGTRAGPGIARIARLLREHSGRSLGIQISEAQVVLVLPRALPADAH